MHPNAEKAAAQVVHHKAATSPSFQEKILLLIKQTSSFNMKPGLAQDYNSGMHVARTVTDMKG
ncbi:MAG: hypothetical protein FRX49_12611 [Trebouxia sp. A1-2]|nr:MAG: hypothetical protein FRX49_12611 [Trebouxia sp. A1-2]